ncbi:hypothetical protein OA57_01640 [Chelonobacter oris]|uniref:Glycosyl transferase family 1 domain-containing protein n=1 Tax=Chelonobacter oris TaxID=505317 RepID=A0A0A3AT72_9PAST|nr:glycosyltransferase [Chelonobacter oris]KGQ70977.1 hypothetical protein OA57_01640 [Chelonobacter oris]
MKKIIYINGVISKDYRSNLFSLFSKEITNNMEISSSFIGLDNNIFPIFTNVGKFEFDILNKKKISKYGLILDSDNLNNLDKISYDFILGADFCYIFGVIDKELNKDIATLLENVNNSYAYDGLIPNFSNKSLIDRKNNILTDFSSLPDLYEELIKNKITPLRKEIIVISSIKDVSLDFWKNRFSELNLELIFIQATNDIYKELLLTYKDGFFTINNKVRLDACLVDEPSSLCVNELLDNIQLFTSNLEIKKNNIINIICYKPSYLFKDLVERFVNIGCVHSDFPIENADAYIWMRPQEIWHIEYLINNQSHAEISKMYEQDFKSKNLYLKFDEIKKRSVAIHHGTCFEPLYQFDYMNLARSLATVGMVVGVCEFEECYGPSLPIANKNNYKFVPIGYDHTIFIKDLVKKTDKKPKNKLKIGFVGRAYGTTDRALLKKSKMAEPKGYRKGGDYLFDIASRLKLYNFDFELHILGQNWEYLVDELERCNIDVVYYARDKNITYKEYPKVYSQLDALLITARCEGGPVSAIEALSLGVPVISTDVGVVKFLEQHFKKDNLFGCATYMYDKKWHIADIPKAIQLIDELYSLEISMSDRIRIRNKVENFTTDSWVESIYTEAKGID